MFTIISLLSIAVAARAQITVHLSNQTNQAFDAYIKAAEAKMEWKANPATKAGKIEVASWAGKGPVQVEEGLIHDWVGSVEVPGATAERALAMFQDYGAYKKVFAPAVLDSSLASRAGELWRVHLRLQQQQGLVTAAFDTDYDVEYRALERSQFAILSRSTRIAELDGGKDLPVGTGSGFLWRLNSYWLIAPRPGGVYLECRAISLSRDIPLGLGWMIKPMVSSVPRDSLRDSVDAARRALR